MEGTRAPQGTNLGSEWVDLGDKFRPTAYEKPLPAKLFIGALTGLTRAAELKNRAAKGAKGLPAKVCSLVDRLGDYCFGIEKRCLSTLKSPFVIGSHLTKKVKDLNNAHAMIWGELSEKWQKSDPSLSIIHFDWVLSQFTDHFTKYKAVAAEIELTQEWAEYVDRVCKALATYVHKNVYIISASKVEKVRFLGGLKQAAEIRAEV